MTKFIAKVWRAVPRGVRWAGLALVVLTVAAGVRVGVLVLRSNAPYAAEIAADVAAWETGRAERARMREEAKAALGELPDVFHLREYSALALAMARNDDTGYVVDKMFDFYRSLPEDLWGLPERRIVPGLLDATDPMAHLYGLLLAESAWIAEPAHARAAVMIPDQDGGSNRAPADLTAFLGVAAANAHRGDASLAFEAALAGMEALAATPGPFDVHAYREAFSRMRLLSVICLSSAGRTSPSEAQWTRFLASLDAVSDPVLADDALRMTAARHLTPDAPPYRHTDSPFWDFGLYGYARNYRAIASGATPRPFDLFGYAAGQERLENDAGHVEHLPIWYDMARYGAEAIRSIRRFAVEHGRLPKTEAEVTSGVAVARPPGVSIDGASDGTMRLSLPYANGRRATVIRVAPLSVE